MRTCAVCGVQLRHYDLCAKCSKQWGIDGVYPDWVVELIVIQKHFECWGSARDENITDLGLDSEEEE